MEEEGSCVIGVELFEIVLLCRKNGRLIRVVVDADDIKRLGFDHEYIGAKIAVKAAEIEERYCRLASSDRRLGMKLAQIFDGICPASRLAIMGVVV